MSGLAWAKSVDHFKNQIYVSLLRDPFKNLSIEHHLLQCSPPDSVALFLYINRPCVVIGRNQNPWLEVNLALRESKASPSAGFDYVRRRSGGGGVYHDEGNLNYSVICPRTEFKRDKHAEMVTSAVRQFNGRARVNDRHDLVIDQGPSKSPQELAELDPDDMHVARYRSDDAGLPSLKVSGSAFKMTRERALHHGTLLLNSPYVTSRPGYLDSPARPFIKARGVDSVRSPVGNILSRSLASRKGIYFEVMQQIVTEFQRTYSIGNGASKLFRTSPPEAINPSISHTESAADDEWTSGYLGEDITAISEIRDGISELQVRTLPPNPKQ